eukprot:scaffold2273_cov195-Skeletonema_marinoi.AAC.2
MKFYIIAAAAAAAILTTGVNAQQDGDGPCNPCPGGITADPDTETIPGRTCGGVQEDASRFDADSNVCKMITDDSKEKCCPGDVVTIDEDEDEDEVSACSVCPGGLTVPGDTEIPNTRGITCGEMMNDAETTEEESNMCTQMKGSEETCCPETPAAPESTTCSVCPDGIPAENVDIPTIGSKTCKDLLIDAPQQTEGSNICDAMKSSEDVCCPFVATTTAATTTVEATTTIAPDVVEVITPSPTEPVPTAPPTNKPTIGPTSRDQLFGNILPTPVANLDITNPSPTLAPAQEPKDPTYGPTTYAPTYSPTYNELAGRGKPPPDAGEPGFQFNLPGDKAGAPSAGVSAYFRLGVKGNKYGKINVNGTFEG